MQNEDGGWGTRILGPSTMFGTCLNYVTLRLLGNSSEHDSLSKGRAWILSHGSATAIPQWGKIWLSVLSNIEWNSFPYVSFIYIIAPLSCMFADLFSMKKHKVKFYLLNALVLDKHYTYIMVHLKYYIIYMHICRNLLKNEHRPHNWFKYLILWSSNVSIVACVCFLGHLLTFLGFLPSS
jgi:hypothetical protein